MSGYEGAAGRHLTARLAAGFIACAVMACTATPPAPTTTPTSAVAASPTHTPLPTLPPHTPLPAHTPLPSHTPIANATPLTTAGQSPTGSGGPSTAGWPMFHADEAHTGDAAGVAHIANGTGPRVLAQYRVFDQPAGEGDLAYVRWTSTLPLADLDGDGRLDIVVTTPDTAAPVLARLNGQPIPNSVRALSYTPGSATLTQKWIYQLPSAPGEAGLDTYSPAIADANGDGLPDVIFTARDDYVRALSGRDGSLIWQFNMGRITEAGPMLADLNGDGSQEVIAVTDCAAGIVTCGAGDGQAALFVLPARGSGNITPLWTFNYPYKMDSAEPAIADVPGVGKVIIVGTWGGELLGVWRAADGTVRTAKLSLRDLQPGISALDQPPVIRVSPLVTYPDGKPTITFGWLPTDQNAQDGRLTAVTLTTSGDQVSFSPLWTIKSLDTWKSSPALVRQPDGTDLAVLGYGLGIGPPPSQSGSVGSCDSQWVFGGVAGVDGTGAIKWQHDFNKSEGNLRASAAVADMNGDGTPDVIIPSGCYGKLHAFNGLTGAEEWSMQLGPRSQGSPSLADVTGDGSLDIVLSSYDGQVWVLGGG